MRNENTQDAPDPGPTADGPVERLVRPRTCATCAHRNGPMKFGTCMLSGFFIETERRYPSVCGAGFENWTKREPLLRRLRAWLYAE